MLTHDLLQNVREIHIQTSTDTQVKFNSDTILNGNVSAFCLV